jgi:hypothetical protein
VEKSAPAVLFAKLSAAREQGKELWGLNVQPLGEYARRQITPFEQAIAVQSLPQITSQLAVANEAAMAQPSKGIAPAPTQLTPSRQLWEKYSLPPSGVLAAMAKHNPQLQAMQDGFMAKQAICEGNSAQAVEQAITEHSPSAQRSPDARAYAKGLVEQAASAVHKPLKQRQAQIKARSQTSKRAKVRDNDIGI